MISKSKRIDIFFILKIYFTKHLTCDIISIYLYIIIKHKLNAKVMKTIGTLTHSRTNEFQGAKFLNDSYYAYQVLDSLLEAGWYPEETDCAWTDVAVIDGKYYAAFGEDSVMASDAKMIYIEIEPTASMVKEYEYIQQY